MKPISEIAEKLIADNLPYAEEGLTMEEIKLLSKRGTDILPNDEWVPELLTRFHNIALYIISKKILIDGSFPPPQYMVDTHMKTLKIQWKIWIENFEVGVSVYECKYPSGDYGERLADYMIKIDEMLNPTRVDKMRRFGL